MGSFTEHTKNILAVAYSPDGKLLATVSEDNTARIWQDGQVRKIINVNDVPRRVVWSPDSQQIAVASDKHVTVWNTDGKKGPELPEPPASLVALAWNHSTDQIAAGGWSRTFQLWDGEGHKAPLQTQCRRSWTSRFIRKARKSRWACSRAKRS